MIAPARPVPQRRGACPGLSAPMPTGDGLLVRLLPIGTVALAAFAELCAAARTHGNGVVEITSRGSIQVRGLSAASASQFAADIAAVGIAAEDGVPILCNALGGIAADEILDAGALALALRRALKQRSMTTKLGAKVSVAIDGGGALNLDGLAADVRLRAEATNAGVALRVGVGGDGATATELGMTAVVNAVEVATRLLEVLAKRGRDGRARDIVATEGAAVFRAAIADLLLAPPLLDSRLRGKERKMMPRQSADAIGLHPLRDGALACGVGLAFGHAGATALERLADAAHTAGASGMRAAAGRALMTIGLQPETSSAFIAMADRLGFIVRADDARRHVVACAGAPSCASAHIAARAIAPVIAAAAVPRIDGAFTIHISGCAKGCAHVGPAALTVVGAADGCALIANGSPRDAPFAVVQANELPAAIAKYMRELSHEGGHV